MKLTKAQKDILAGSEVLSISAITGNVWARKRGFSVKVRKPTFEAMVNAGLYAPSGSNGLTRFYTITDAGRAALSEPSS